MPRVTAEEAAEMTAAVAAGRSVLSIAKQYGRNYETVLRACGRLGGKGSGERRAFAPDEAKAAIEAYRNGEAAASIGRRLGRTTRTVVRMLRKNGVAVNSERQNENRFAAVADRAAELYRQGLTLAQVGDAVGFSEMTVYTNFVKRGILIRQARKTRVGIDEAVNIAEDHRHMGIAALAQKYGHTADAIIRTLKRMGAEAGAGPSVEAVSGKMRCSVCEQFKAEEEYATNLGSATGIGYICKDCHRWVTRERKYGLSKSKYDELLATQGGRCAVCGDVHVPTATHPDLVIDHCHVTGKVRGLLCPRCNSAIGLQKDRADVMASAAAYLRRANGEAV